MLDNFKFETFVDAHSNIFEEYLSSVIYSAVGCQPDRFLCLSFLGGDLNNVHCALLLSADLPAVLPFGNTNRYHKSSETSSENRKFF